MTKARPILIVLDEQKTRVIRLQASIIRNGSFFLAGGVGLALQLGHRLSTDLDWFTREKFDASRLQRNLESLSEPPTQVLQHGRHTLRAYYGTLETSFITYGQFPVVRKNLDYSGLKIPVADITSLAVMKAAALHDRGAKRDFIDIHAICSQPGWSMGRFIEHSAGHLPLEPAQIARALTYFVDADPDPMPAGFGTDWKKIKADITKAVQKWEKEVKRR